jgi:phosphate transport system substrate-binding protein
MTHQTWEVTVKISIRALTSTIALALVLSACSSGSSGGLTGTVSGDGSSTVYLITEAVAEEFKAAEPNVDVTVGIGGTGGGFKKFCSGETDLQDASRPIKAEEKEACTAKGIEYVELTVANDGLAILANPKNTWAECLTTAELKKIWEPNSKVATWKDIRPSFPATKLSLFGPGTDSGTFDFFTKEINGEEGASRQNYTPSEDDALLVTGVAGDPGALGYFGYGYYAESKDKLKLLGVDAGEGCIQPSDETVRDGTYHPLSRPLYLYVKKASIERPEVVAFMDFYLDTMSELAHDVGYTPLSDAALQAERAKWDAAKAAA